MSKRLGNTVDPFDVMDKYGADAVRWYLLSSNPPWRTTLFNEDDIAKTVISDFFRSLTNTYSFFALYANIDGFTGEEELIDYSKRPEIDKWIISKLNTLINDYTKQMNEYDLTKATRLVQKFVINELSNWYIRRNRRRFWKGEKDNDKIAAYQTLREVLIQVSALMAPVAPFLSEELYQRLRNKEDKISIHLIDMPKANDELIDIELERRMETAQAIVSLARFLREKSKMRVRQPLRRILVPVLNPTQRRDIQAVSSIILEEINIKDIEFVTDETSNIISKQAKGNFKTLGRKFGKQTQMVANAIKELTNEQIRTIEVEKEYELTLADNSTVKIALEDIEIHSNDMEGWLVASENGLTVALDTTLDDDLIQEGMVGFSIALNTYMGFEVIDRISITIKANDDIQKAIENKQDYIKAETLALDINFVNDLDAKKIDLLDNEIIIDIKKI